MDLTSALLAAMALASAHPSAPPADSICGPVIAVPRIAAVPAVALSDARRDTIIEYSSAYYTRLTVHRWGSYAMLPLFAAQYYAGSQLISGDGDDRAEDAHAVLAASIGALFAANTTTGLWNLWDMRHDPNGRRRRVAHVALMLLADAGFVATGIVADEAEDEPGGARSHRAMALTSMALSTTGWLLMTDLFRKD